MLAKNKRRYITKKEAPRADWGVIDPNELGYIENKPFGEEYGNLTLIPEQTFTAEPPQDADGDGITGYACCALKGEMNYSVGMTAMIVFDGVTYEAEIEDGYWGGGDTYIVSRFTVDDNSICIIWDTNSGGIGIDCPLLGNHTIYAYTEDDKEIRIKQIDEKYIPDTIARVSDVEEVINSTSLTESDAINLAFEMGLIDSPVTDANGAIFTNSEKNIIYTL